MTSDENQSVEKIDFEELVKEYTISDSIIFNAYLKDIYNDLILRCNNKSQGLDINTFSKYYELPGIISQRLFTVLDTDNDGYLDILDFIDGMVTLFSDTSDTYERLVKLIFKIYDFDNDQKISKEDIRTVLCYVSLNTQNKVSYLKSKYGKETFTDRIESQEELHNLSEKVFKSKETLTIDEFFSIIENTSSDIFLFILILLFENRPFSKNTLANYKQVKSKLISKTPMIYSRSIKLIASPSLHSKFIPSLTMSKSPVIIKKTILTSTKSLKSKYELLMMKLTGKTQNIDKKNNLLKYVSQPSNSSKISKYCATSTDPLINTYPPQRKLRNNLKTIENIDSTNYFCIINDNDENNNKNDTEEFPITPAVKYEIKYHSTKCYSKLNDEEEMEQETSQSDDFIKYEGYLFKINSSNKLKRLWCKLIHKDLYYYKNSEETQTYKGIHNISGVYINIEKEIDYESNFKLYCFSLIFEHKTLYFYVDNQSDYYSWVNILQKATGYKNLTDIYNVSSKIGIGKFGEVRLAQHKKSLRKVAVKILSKINMKNHDLCLMRTEIEILKICQHPNIIKLYDMFENSNYIYLIMEYCEGGDLFSFLLKREFKISEYQAAEIVHKLCTAVYYLHSYGIAHRDLKPENILITVSDSHDLKLLDFGLSKIIGPSEVCNEPYGTLSYVAPEVLMEIPYTKSVDMWSIGVISYLLLSGVLPFDHPSDAKEIVRQTIYDPVPFPNNLWVNVSNEGIQFVQNLLQKNPLNRISISQALEHNWFKKANKSNMTDIRIKSKDLIGSSFKLYTQTNLEGNNKNDP